MTSFEEAFSTTERAADSVVTAASALLKVAKEMVKASREGDIARIRKASERLGLANQAVRQEVGNALSAWPLAPEEEEELFAQSFGDELIEVARREGLNIRRQDDRLVAFPSLLRILPGRRSIEIDKKSVSGVRPSRLVRLLKANADKKPRSSPERFIEILYEAFSQLAGGSSASGVPLHRVYSLLTLMPDWRKEYTPADFSRDLFFLDRSGKKETKSGAKLSLPASTGTKGGRVFSFVAPDGEVVTYYGLRFQQ